jgi:hypothetical protein
MFKNTEEAVGYLESQGYKVTLSLSSSYNPASKYCKACLDPMDSFSLKCKNCIHPPIESITDNNSKVGGDAIMK